MKRLGLVEELLVLKREGQQHHRRTRLGALARRHRGSGVTPINTATNRPGKAIKVGGSASLIAITPNGTTAYFVVGNSLVPINSAHNQVGRAIKAGTQPVAIAFTPRRSGSRGRCQPPLRLISRFEHPGLLASADLG